MRLAEIPSSAVPDLAVVRDGPFESLGFVTHGRAGMLVFVASADYLPSVAANRSVASVVTAPALADLVATELGVAVSADPRLAFYRLQNHLVAAGFYGHAGITRISDSARVHETAWVSPTGVEIDEGVTVAPRATILSGTRIGRGSTIRAGAVIGSEGFQVIVAGPEFLRVNHGGGVQIGANVDIHANTCVDRGLFGDTVIGDDATIDDLVYVAHETRIGRRSRVGAHAVINGSTVIGDGAWIGPGAVLTSGVSVGAGAAVSLGSVVTKDVPDGGHVTGNFAIDHERFLAHLRGIR